LTGVKYLDLFTLWILPIAVRKNNNKIESLHFWYMIFPRSDDNLQDETCQLGQKRKVILNL
jgi:hypothetical protein